MGKKNTNMGEKAIYKCDKKSGHFEKKDSIVRWGEKDTR